MKRIIFLLTALSFAFSNICAQTVGYLENDKRVYKGVMENGLSYYLVKNSVIKGYADFTLVRKTNGLLENETCFGMTKLTECMSLTETENFPDGRSFAFLDNMGLDNRKDLKIDITNNDAVFSLKNIPLIKNDNVCDSVLLLLYNMASRTMFDESSVSNGKDFFANAFSATMTLSNRVTDSLQRYYFRGDSAARYNPSLMFPAISGYTAGEIRRFYENNYRPDNQALIIVGDIDVKSTETKIKALFQIIPKPRLPLAVAPEALPDIDGKEFFYFEDCEADCAEISMHFPVSGIAQKLKNTAIPFVHDYLSNISVHAIKWRLMKDLYNLPFYVKSLDVSSVPFLNEHALRITLKCAPRDYKAAYAFLASETERMISDGIGESEFRIAEKAVLSEIQYRYDGRGMTDNEVFTDMCIANFTENSAMFGIELYKNYIDEANKSIDAAILNKFIDSVIGSGKCVTTCVSPIECEGLDLVTIPKLPPYMDPASVFTYQQEDDLHKNDWKAQFVSKSTGFVSKKLANGAVLAYKNQKIEPGWILFEAVARGGIASVGKDYAALQRIINEVSEISIIGGMNKYQTAETKASSLIELNRVISAEDRKLTGRFHKDHLDEFLQLVHLYFEHCEEDKALFEKYSAAESALIPYSGNSPENVFEALRNSYVSADIQNDQNDNLPSTSSLQDYHKTLALVDSLFSDVSDFSFFFVGDFDKQKLTESANRHIGQLKGKRKVRRERESDDFSFICYNNSSVRHLAMTYPRCFHSCRFTFPSKQTVEERALSEMAAEIIKREVRRKFPTDRFFITEDRQFYSYPQEIMTIEFAFTSAPGFYNAENLENDFAKIIAGMTEREISPDEINAVKKNILMKNKFIQAANPYYEMSVLRDRFINKKDFYTDLEASVNAIDKSKIDDFLKKISERCRISLCSVLPEDKTE